MRRCFVTFLYGLYILLCCAFRPSDAFAAPLLIEGKKTLYQRVVSHPGATLFASPDAQSAVVNNNVKTFTVFYVYGRQNNRVQVGVSDRQADGWLDADKTTVWNQSLTMLFTSRMGRSPVLFFKDHDSLEKLCLDNELDKKIRHYEEIVRSGKTPPDFPVIAQEPPETAVSEKNFYLLPVLNVDNAFGESAKLLEVASIDPGGDAGTGSGNSSGASSPDVPDSGFRTGFVFVIDTTISMKPYIDQTLKLVRSIYDELEKNPHGDKIAFAVMAFRSNTELTPALEYATKLVSDFKTYKQRAELENALAQVREASVSSHSFDEDSFAGIKDAADNLSWQNYASKIMLLITDAGPLREGDKASRTGMSPAVMAEYLKKNNIYLTAVHVKSPKGKNDHASAESAYRELAKQADNQTSYIAIDASSPQKGAADFDAVGRRLAHGYSDLVTATAEGKLLAAPIQTSPQKKLSPEEQAERIALSTGYAIQLQFFGDRKGSRAPSVVRAWVADADLGKLSRDPQAQPVIAIQPAVLVTKTQLSQLRAQLKAIFESAQQSFLKDVSQNFFQNILSAAAQMTRDPQAFTQNPGKNLAQSGVLGEFLDGLPYRSRILNLKEDDWYQMSTGEQKSILNHLEARIRFYEECDRDNTHWEGFGSPNRDEWVYRLPLSMLP
ncbi:MAG: VWA domain-containing protein [Desulfovibrio sp.]|jgi:serine/threonine-protein kinase PpkA|nr:VWA domain-containing protein [Desulfovibrio sp.]